MVAVRPDGSTRLAAARRRERAAVGVIEGLGDAVAQDAQVGRRKALEVGELVGLAVQQPGQLHHLGVGLEQLSGPAHPTMRLTGPRSSRGM